VPSRPTSKRPAGEVGLSPVTSTDIARMAGVSRSTVSLILNDQDARFSPDTVERVRACATTLGYVRSAAGRALVKGHSDFIVLVVPYTTFVKLQLGCRVLVAGDGVVLEKKGVRPPPSSLPVHLSPIACAHGE